jgi:hypothetical protein
MPEPTEGEIRECVLSRAGENFGAGNITSGEADDLGNLDVEGQKVALRRARQWCKGLYNSTHISDRTIQEINNAFEAAQEGLDNGEPIQDLSTFRNPPEDETEDTVELDEDSVEVVEG